MGLMIRCTFCFPCSLLSRGSISGSAFSWALSGGSDGSLARRACAAGRVQSVDRRADLAEYLGRLSPASAGEIKTFLQRLSTSKTFRGFQFCEAQVVLLFFCREWKVPLPIAVADDVRIGLASWNAE